MSTEREKVYDAELFPLMARLIEICKAHDIPLLASFQLDDERDPKAATGFFCITAILPEDSAPALRMSAQLVREGFAAFGVRTRSAR